MGVPTLILAPSAMARLPVPPVVSVRVPVASVVILLRVSVPAVMVILPVLVVLVPTSTPVTRRAVFDPSTYRVGVQLTPGWLIV
jgi:hypothetical protein